MEITERLNVSPKAFAPLSKAERNARIKAVNGSNHAEVCTEFRISRWTLYRVVGAR